MVCPPTEVSPKINRRPVALGDGEPGAGEGRAAMHVALTIAMAVALAAARLPVGPTGLRSDCRAVRPPLSHDGALQSDGQSGLFLTYAMASSRSFCTSTPGRCAISIIVWRARFELAMPSPARLHRSELGPKHRQTLGDLEHASKARSHSRSGSRSPATRGLWIEPLPIRIMSDRHVENSSAPVAKICNPRRH